ncbi:MAG: zinc ribbon domain-containing protein [Chloroflexi bacterium]|nr:zinc ribbon domain-containing protein [Chloroflexota bacterium]
MQELNSRKRKFYSTAMRSFILLVVLFILLAVSKDINMLQNQQIPLDSKEIITGVDIAKALLALLIVGILINFAHVAETQLPFIVSKIPQSGLIVSSAVHIGIIFIAYMNLLEIATDRGTVNPIFNAVFLLLLCIPLFRGGKALYDGIDRFANETTKVFDESKPAINNTSQVMVCKSCGTNNDITAKHCIECGNSLQEPKTSQQFIACPLCGEKNPPNAKYCSECATNLTRTTAKSE